MKRLKAQENSLFQSAYNLPYDEMTRNRLYRCSKGNLELVQRLGLFKKLPVHTGCVNTICWNESGEHLLSGSDDQHLVITNGFTHKVVEDYKTSHRANIFSAKFLPCIRDSRIVSCSGDGIILFTDLMCKEEPKYKQFNCHCGTTYEVATVPLDPNSFLSCGEDGTVRWYDLRIKDKCSKLNCQEDVMISCQRAVTALAVNATAPYQLGIGCSDSTVRLYDRRLLGTKASGMSHNSAQPLCTFTVPTFKRAYRITSLCFSPEGDEILVSYSSDDLYLFSIKDQESKVLSAGLSSRKRRVNQSPTPVRRLRLRGDWSDTGPDARPERECSRGEIAQARPTLHTPLMQHLTNVISRLLNDPATRAALNAGGEDTIEGGAAAPAAAPASASASSSSSSPQPTAPAQPLDTAGTLEVSSLGNDQEEPMAGPSTSTPDCEMTDVAEGTPSNKKLRLNQDSSSAGLTAGAAGVAGTSEPPSSAVPATGEQLEASDLRTSSANMDGNSIGNEQSVRQEPNETSEDSGEFRILPSPGPYASQPPFPFPALNEYSRAYVRVNLRVVDRSSRAVLAETSREVVAEGTRHQSQSQAASDSESTMSVEPSTSTQEIPQENSACHSNEDATKNHDPENGSESENCASESTVMSVDTNDRAEDISTELTNGSQNVGTSNETVEEASVPTQESRTTVELDREGRGTTGLYAEAGIHQQDLNILQSRLVDLRDGFLERHGMEPGVNLTYSELGSSTSHISLSSESEALRNSENANVPEDNTALPASASNLPHPEVPVEVGNVGSSASHNSLEACHSGAAADSAVPSSSAQSSSRLEPAERAERAERAEPGPSHDFSSNESISALDSFFGDDFDSDEEDIRDTRRNNPSINRRRSHSDSVDDETLVPEIKQKYTGHRNARTMIKEATFWGSDYVMSGSDCGHVFIWERVGGRLVMLLEADAHVVNCLQPHPVQPLLATSGIDHDIKLWAPIQEEPNFNQRAADEITKRNALMLEETKDTITVPASFMIRMVACLNQIRRGGRTRSRRRPQDSEED